MVEKRGPLFPNTVRSDADLKKLHVSDASELRYVTDAIRIASKELNGRVPLIGFAGAPWTIFSYMVEGHGSKTFSAAREMLYTQPAFSHKLLQMITDSTINYLKAQIEAGAQLVQLFDSWAGILGPKQYAEFSMPYISQICDAITTVPKTVFAKGAFFAREEMGKLNCETIGLDWNMGITESSMLIGADKTLQGNLDPAALYGTTDQVRKATTEMMEQFRGTRHIANLGHGVYPDINPEMVKVFIQTVKDFK